MDEEVDVKCSESGESFNPGRHGTEFEIDVSELLLKRLFSDPTCHNFHFTREKKGVGKFDDLAFIRHTRTKQMELFLVQMKHVEDEKVEIDYSALAEADDWFFYLPKYFKYFLQSQKTITMDKDISGAEIKNLFLCTNLRLKQDLGDFKRKFIANNDLFKGVGDLYQVEISDEGKQRVFSNCYLSEHKKLANELVYYLISQKRIDIKSMKSDENVSMIKTYHIPLSKQVIDVKMKTLKGNFLSKLIHPNPDNFAKTFLESLSEFCAQCKVLNARELQKNLKIKSQKECEQIKASLLYYEQCDSLEKVRQFLENQSFSINKFFGDETLDNEDRKTMPGVEDICIDEINQKIDHFLNLLIFVTRLRGMKIMTEMEFDPNPVTSVVIYKSFRDKILEWFYEGVTKDRKTGILMREWLSKNRIAREAMDSHIIFQGRKVKLKDQVDAVERLHSDLLIRMFCQHIVVVGQSPLRKEGFEYYVPRALLTEDGKTIAGNDSFKNGGSPYEVNFGNTNRFVILCGKPGMGKTSYIDKITEILINVEANSDKPKWILKIALSDYVSKLKEWKSMQDINCVVDFFASVENCNDLFSRDLLKEFIVAKGRAIILLDGFDEIVTEEDQNKILQLLRVLKVETNVSHVWISTRPHLKETLENCLGVTSHTLIEINKSEQIRLLTQYWKTQANHEDTQKLSKFACDLIEKFNESITKNWQSFLGVPLQTFMLGYVFLDEVKKSHPVAPEALPIAALFEKFIRQKYHICLEKENPNISMRNKNYDRLIQKLDQEHQNVAFAYIKMSPLDYSVTQFGLNESTIINTDLIDVGIMYKERNKIRFIHRTFAEYLAAKFLVRICENPQVYRAECIEIIKNLLLNVHNEFCCSLFDYMVAEKYFAHASALKGDEKTVKILNKEESNVKDCLGRSPIYYALKYDRCKIIKILIGKQIHVDPKDRFISSYFINHEDKFHRILFKNEFFTDLKNLEVMIESVRLALYLCDTITKEDDLFVYLKAHQVKRYAKLFSLLARPDEPIEDLCCSLWDSLKPLFDSIIHPEQWIVEHDSPLKILFHFFRSVPKLFDLEVNELHVFLKNESYFKNHVHTVMEASKKALKMLYKDLEGNMTEEDAKQIYDNMYNYLDMMFCVTNYFCKSINSFKRTSCLDYVRQHTKKLMEIWKSLMSSNVVCRNETEWKNNLKIDFMIHFSKGHIYDEMSMKSLKRDVDEGLIAGEEAKDITELWSVIKDDGERLGLTEKDPFVVAQMTVALNIILSSDAILLLDSFHELHQAIKHNNATRTWNCLKEAEIKGWIESILNAVNEDFESVENIAERKGLGSILEILSGTKSGYWTDVSTDKEKPRKQSQTKELEVPSQANRSRTNWCILL